MWLELLRLKYSQSATAAVALLETGDLPLLEFDRHAKASAQHGHRAHWGGLYDEKEKILYGDNVMGQYLTSIRGELRDSLQDDLEFRAMEIERLASAKCEPETLFV